MRSGSEPRGELVKEMRPAGFHGIFRDDEPARAIYSEAAGIGRIIPAAVAVPQDADDVAALVKWAAKTRTALIPRGSGSSMAGGAIGAGVVVDLSRINHLSRIDTATRTVWADPGVLWSTLDVAARRRGLRFPVDPSSGKFCTIGGMVSTNASGARSLLHGPTRRWVNAVDCVFSEGDRAVVTRGDPAPERLSSVRRFMQEAHAEIVAADRKNPIRHKGVLKESSGYAIHDYSANAELIDLLVGSEGTLAIIVAVQVKLAPVAAATTSVLASFGSLDEASRGAAAARDAGASACELLDATFLSYAASVEGKGGGRRGAVGAAAILIAEAEGESEDAARAQAKRLEEIFRECGASAIETALTAEAEHELWELRHAASPILAALEDATSMQFIEDGAVPPASLPAYVRGVRAALDSQKVPGVIFGHAGDSHVHVNPLLDLRDPDWRGKVESLLESIVSLTSQLGGTLAGEHGDGRLRTPLLDRVWSTEARRCFALVKTAFDPDGIFNPGVKIPLAGQKALGDIKYDPGLPPLPALVRESLDAIVRDRSYHEFRLSLVEKSA